jgi:hypothetical protein
MVYPDPRPVIFACVLACAANACHVTTGHRDSALASDGPDDVLVDAADAPQEPPCDPSPDFSLEDLNPLSPTHGMARSVSGQRGEVLLVYFANYA